MVGGVTARYRPVAHTVRLLNLLSEGVGELGISLAATDRALHELDGAPEIGESGGAGDTCRSWPQQQPSPTLVCMAMISSSSQPPQCTGMEVLTAQGSSRRETSWSGA